MSQAEYHRWVDFYRSQPFDDFHRYHRPAALVSVSLAGGDIKERLEWLQPDDVPDGLNDADVRTIKALGMLPNMKE